MILLSGKVVDNCRLSFWRGFVQIYLEYSFSINLCLGDLKVTTERVHGRK